jgi:hypothetical protein
VSARALAAAAAAWLCACAPELGKVPRVGERPPVAADDARERAYQEVLARYSAHQELYARLDTRFFAAATFQSPAFREARVRRAAEFRRLPAAEVEKQLAEERAAAAAGHEVFLAAHFTDPRFDDLDKKASQWRLALVTAKGEVTPAKVERLGRSTMDLRSLYPYFDEFWVGFKLTFPRTFPDGTEVLPEGTERVTLRMASALGDAELTFPAR